MTEMIVVRGYRLGAARGLSRAASWAAFFLLASQGCGEMEDASDPMAQVSEEASELAQVVAAGDGGLRVDAGSTLVDAGTVALPSKLTFKVQTAPFGGRYRPKNIGAIWIETSAGTYVKTLERWARIRARYLTRFAASTKNNVTDAVSSATLANHRAHTATWNLTNVAGKRVPDGAYRLAIELTDRDGPGALLYVPFTLGAAQVKLSPAATPQFSNMELRIE